MHGKGQNWKWSIHKSSLPGLVFKVMRQPWEKSVLQTSPPLRGQLQHLQVVGVRFFICRYIIHPDPTLLELLREAAALGWSIDISYGKSWVQDLAVFPVGLERIPVWRLPADWSDLDGIWFKERQPPRSWESGSWYHSRPGFSKSGCRYKWPPCSGVNLPWHISKQELKRILGN